MTTSLPRVTAPPGLSPAELTAFVRGAAANTALWQPRLQVPDGAERWWTRLFADDCVDLWLLSWLPGQTTELHDHGDSAAAYTVVHGELAEDRIDVRGRGRHTLLGPGSLTALRPGAIHDVCGSGDGLAVSIHAYSPPLRQMNYHAPDENGELRVVGSVQTDQPEEELIR